MKMRKLIILLFIVSLYPLAAQSNEMLDRFLAQDKADLATTALLVYQAAGVLSTDSTPDDAISKLKSDGAIGQRYSGKSAEDPVTFGEYAQIAMVELKLPGGLMYRIFKSPRYAARELTFRRWMPGKPVPAHKLTPWDVTTSLSQILAWKEGHK